LTHPFNWKKASMAAALCYGVRGGGAQLAFHVTAGNYDTDTLIEVLGELRRFLGGEKAMLLWDGLPAHRSNAMRAWLATQRSWLVVERLPAYAPELNPIEGLWSSLKAVELANLASPTLAEVITQAHMGVERVRQTPHLAYSFLRHAGLVGLMTPQPDTQVPLGARRLPAGGRLVVGWPGGFSPPGSHRSGRDSLPSPGSCHPGRPAVAG